MFAEYINPHAKNKCSATTMTQTGKLNMLINYVTYEVVNFV